MLNPTTTALALRDYQSALSQGIYEQWRNHRRIMAQLPTGGGKTVVFSAIAREFTRRGEGALVLAHRQELITQAAAKLAAVAGCSVGIIKAGHRPDYSAPIQVASVQSVVRRLHHLRPPGLVIIDEAHHATAATYRKVLDAFPTAYQLGVSATPCRTDGSGFADLFDALVTGPTVADLIDAGHLSRFRLFADPNPMSTGGARTRQGDYSTGDVAELNPVIELSGNLVASYQRHCPGKSCIVFAINIEHSQAIAERYQAHGIPAAHLDGESTPEHRRATLEAFARGELLVLSNVGLFTEGFDLPALDAVQVARPTKSLGLWLQMVGRALRPAPGKDCAILLDHTKNWAIHGLPTRPRRWSLEGVTTDLREAKANDNGEIEEVQLGLPMPADPTEILESDAALTEVDTSPAAEWERAWAELLATQQTRGYKPGWLAFQLRDLQAPLVIWEHCAKVLGYRPGWAWHKYREHTLGDAPESPAPAPPAPAPRLRDSGGNLFEMLLRTPAPPAPPIPPPPIGPA